MPRDRLLRRRRNNAPHAAHGVDAIAVTKLRAPDPQDEWISRSALVRRLTHARAERLIVIAAPAGYGKSTLAAQWRTDPDETRRFAWVSLDHGDNVPSILWSSILRSLNDIAAMTGVAGDLLRLPDDRPAVIDDAFLSDIVNRLAEHGAPVVLVLDDCHVIRDPSCLRQLRALVEWLPPNAQVALVTRGRLPLPLARFRASGQIVEFGVEDLRFNAEETDRFVRRFSNVQLAGEDLDRLVERTEGWPAGVHLAALGMREHREPAAFTREFDGANQYVVDYFSEEVLAPLSDETFRFLARTSVLESFNASLCGAVTRDPNADAILERLARSGLFVVPLDDRRVWYRYHRLFRGALDRLLRTAEPGFATVLHRRADVWLERHGRVGAAIEHALAAGDDGRAVAIIAAGWPSFAFSGHEETTMLRGWLMSVDTERLAADPVAAVCAAWAGTLAGDRAIGRQWLDTARRLGHSGPLPDGTASLESSAALLESMVGTGGVHNMLASARTAVALETDPASPWYSLARHNLGCGHYLAGDQSTAIAPLSESAQSLAAFAAVQVQSYAVLSLATAELGRETQAAELAETALALAAEHGMADTSRMSLARTAAAATLVRQGRVAEARPLLEAVQHLRRTSPRVTVWPTLENLHLLIGVLLDLGELREARALVGEAAELLAFLPADAGRLRLRHSQVQRQLHSLADTTAPLEPLTDREIAVLRMLRSDKSLRDVGAELFISQNTIKTHTRAIYRKLEASSRAEALRRAQDVGIL
ncbi:LuxR C-terminal-related transcriptional regulator [Actinomadura sp. 9N407]|uniref:LuxR C-terminal-related transcriptional regulator n=1 Tax=Actinomadura sp. 9N407 TaxID=3375154 RepID=UPI00379E4AC7